MKNPAMIRLNRSIKRVVDMLKHNPLTQYGLFGYNYRHFLTHPHDLVKECYYHTKWFFQRGWRGYADCDIWGLDSYLASWMPEALDRLATIKIGTPIGMTHSGWKTRLGHMRDGFLTAREFHEFNYRTPKEAKILMKRMNRGLSVFVEHFLSLWD